MKSAEKVAETVAETVSEKVAEDADTYEVLPRVGNPPLLWVSIRFIHSHTHTDTREHRGGSVVALTLPPPTQCWYPPPRFIFVYDCRICLSLSVYSRAVYVYAVPWSEFPIVPSYPHYPPPPPSTSRHCDD